MKAKLLLLIAGIGMLTLTGCANSMTITETQNNLVAEYAAGLILKYDRYYEEEYIEPSVEKESENIYEAPTTAPIYTPDDTSMAPTGSDNSSSNESKDNTNTEANTDFSGVIGIKGLSIDYDSFEMHNSLSDTYFTIESGDGKQLLVVKFKVKNTTKKDIDMILGSSDKEDKHDYELEDGSGKLLKPMLTLLDNDLRMINTVVAAGETIETVLVFKVSDNIDINNVNIIISEGDKTAVAKLK